MNRFMTVALAVFTAILASLPQVEAKERDSATVAQEESLFWAKQCTLEVVNETPRAWKFRVGHLWWERQNELLPGQVGTMAVERDEEHILVRESWVNGRKQEDKYRFFIPHHTTKYTIIFGGTQTGVWVNRSGVAARVVSPTAVRPVSIRNREKKFDFRVLPGKQRFVVFFGPDFRRYREITLRIDEVRGDNYIETVETRNGQSIIIKKWVDWIGFIEPNDVKQSWELPRYEPGPALEEEEGE